MFNRMINNLAISPSYISQFAFYANRLKKEESIRKIGVFFIILSMLVQVGATMFPAEKSLAADSNSIIAGGVKSKADLVTKCNNNYAGIRDIYGKFGVSCAEINASVATTINSSAYNFWSMGRNPLSNYGISSEDWGERVIHANGVPIYHRPLKAWGSNVSYSAFLVKSSGKNYWIIQDCANLVTIGPEGPAPNLEVSKSLFETPEFVKPGDTVKFKVLYRNPVPESVAVDFRLRDRFDSTNLTLIGMAGQKNDLLSGDPYFERSGLGYSQAWKETTVVAKVKSTVANNTRICNTANASADVVGVKTSNPVCVTVKIDTITGGGTGEQTEQMCQYDSSLKASDAKCARCTINGLTNLSALDAACVETPAGTCIASTAFINNSTKDVTVTTRASVEGNTKVSGYAYELDNKGAPGVSHTSSSLSDTAEFKGLSKGTHSFKVTVNFTNASKSTSSTCASQIDVAEDAKLVQSKSVTDDKGSSMDGKKVSAGTTLIFRLSTKNTTSTTSSSFTGEDYFGDVLEYADIIDMNQLKSQGITLDNNKYLRWTTSSIKGNSEEIKNITVKVKSPVPSTNKPQANSTDQDCVISNKYGNQVTVGINCSLVKNIETTTSSLPNTGPGTTIILAFVATVMAGYFLARARLMGKEALIVKKIYQQTV